MWKEDVAVEISRLISLHYQVNSLARLFESAHAAERDARIIKHLSDASVSEEEDAKKALRKAQNYVYVEIKEVFQSTEKLLTEKDYSLLQDRDLLLGRKYIKKSHNMTIDHRIELEDLRNELRFLVQSIQSVHEPRSSSDIADVLSCIARRRVKHEEVATYIVEINKSGMTYQNLEISRKAMWATVITIPIALLAILVTILLAVPGMPNRLAKMIDTNFSKYREPSP